MFVGVVGVIKACVVAHALQNDGRNQRAGSVCGNLIVCVPMQASTRAQAVGALWACFSRDDVHAAMGTLSGSQTEGSHQRDGAQVATGRASRRLGNHRGASLL